VLANEYISPDDFRLATVTDDIDEVVHVVRRDMPVDA